MNEDFLALLSELLAAEVRFMVVGAYAVGQHGRPRATKDLDVWVEASAENAVRIIAALERFGAPLDGLRASDLETEGTGFMMGAPPRRIDVLTKIDGLDFASAWPNCITGDFGNGVRCPVIGLDDIIKNKTASGRPQDRVDVAVLEKIREAGKRG